MEIQWGWMKGCERSGTQTWKRSLWLTTRNELEAILNSTGFLCLEFGTHSWSSLHEPWPVWSWWILILDEETLNPENEHIPFWHLISGFLNFPEQPWTLDAGSTPDTWLLRAWLATLAFLLK